MNPKPPHSPEEIEQAAAEWVIRLDRGLDAHEQDEFSAWLTRDPRHRTALARLRWGWDELDRLAGMDQPAPTFPGPHLLAPHPARTRRVRAWLATAALTGAALITVAIYFGGHVRNSVPTLSPTAVAHTTACERQVLTDGSVIDLNRGAAIKVSFSATFRHIQLVRGEANFTVAKDAARPFVVDASGVSVRAVGTIFNVHADSSAVEVVVSEGTVKIHRTTAPEATAPLVHAGQHAVVLLANSAPAPHIADLTPDEISARLAWQPRLLDFTDAPLREIVGGFNAHNSVQLVVGDPLLEAKRLSVTFRSDNVEGFVRLLESNFGMRAEWRTDREVVLFRK